MLRKIRITFAILFFVGITLLFLDFSGLLPAYFGWMAKIQFIPAILALNVITVITLLLITIIFGRIYCSVICPLGIMQDFISWFAKHKKKKRFTYSKGKTLLRTTTLILFVIAFILNMAWLASLIEPYSAYGRIINNLLSPIYILCNNIFAYLSERADSYAFYSADIWLKSVPTLIIATITFIIIFILAWKNGRTWCNTICPVGTILGYLSRFALFKPVIDKSKCSGCKQCIRTCKASCINTETKEIDYSRCVTCMNCIDHCKHSALTYSFVGLNKSTKTPTYKNDNRREFLSTSAIIATSSLFAQANKKVDGGLAIIENKKIPRRTTPIVPPGSDSLKRFTTHCTACQLCVSKCPNNVLRPTNSLERLMQPEMSFERGFCRPTCTVCADICPNKAIKPIATEQKSSIKIGTAVWISDNCIANKDSVTCNNCERHCPNGAIKMIKKKDGDKNVPMIPMIDTERCIGCGACEYVCPARPFSAIYVEGIEKHRTI